MFLRDGCTGLEGERKAVAFALGLPQENLLMVNILLEDLYNLDCLLFKVETKACRMRRDPISTSSFSVGSNDGRICSLVEISSDMRAF